MGPAHVESFNFRTKDIRLHNAYKMAHTGDNEFAI